MATTRQEVPWETQAEIQVGFMRLRRTVPSVSAISGEGMWCTRAPELRSQTQTSPATHSQLYYQKHGQESPEDGSFTFSSAEYQVVVGTAQDTRGRIFEMGRRPWHEKTS